MELHDSRWENEKISIDLKSQIEWLKLKWKLHEKSKIYRRIWINLVSSDLEYTEKSFQNTQRHLNLGGKIKNPIMKILDLNLNMICKWKQQNTGLLRKRCEVAILQVKKVLKINLEKSIILFRRKIKLLTSLILPGSRKRNLQSIARRSQVQQHDGQQTNLPLENLKIVCLIP